MERRLGSTELAEVARLAESFGSNMQCSPLYEKLTIGQLGDAKRSVREILKKHALDAKFGPANTK